MASLSSCKPLHKALSASDKELFDAKIAEFIKDDHGRADADISPAERIAIQVRALESMIGEAKEERAGIVAQVHAQAKDGNFAVHWGSVAEFDKEYPHADAIASAPNKDDNNSVTSTESKNEQPESTATSLHGDTALAGALPSNGQATEGSGDTGIVGNGGGAKDAGRASGTRKPRNPAGKRLGNGERDLFDLAGGSDPGAGANTGIPVGTSSAEDAKQIASGTVSPVDYRITDLTNLGAGGQRTKFSNNIDAIRLMRSLNESGRNATAEEQNTLARYVGWGGIPQAFDGANNDWSKQHAELKELLTQEEWDAAEQSTQYAHYTSENVIGGIYSALQHLGFSGGNVLEPGSGVGNFIGLMPTALRSQSRFTGVERESIAGGIAKLLYPNQNVQQQDFTRFNAEDGFFDAVIGNPPFAATALTDLSGRKHLSGLSIHNYFFAKSIDMLRENGVLAMVVTSSFMDAKKDRARSYISERASLLGAIRLPNSAFMGNAGTDVTTDIIFLKKRPESEWNSKASKEDAKRWLDLGSVSEPNGGEAIPVNKYFVDNPSMMLGRMERTGGRYRADMPGLVAPKDADISSMLAKAIKNLPENAYESASVAKTKAMEAAATQAMSNVDVGVGGYFSRDGALYQRNQDIAGENMVAKITPESQWTEKTKLGVNKYEKIVAASEVRSTLRNLIAAESNNKSTMEDLRTELNAKYDAFVKNHGYFNDRASIQLLGDDPDFPLMLSLENSYDPGVTDTAAKKQGIKAIKPSAKKSAIFKGSVLSFRAPVTSAESPVDALMISIAERGRIDPQFIGQLLGTEGATTLDELTHGENPELFIDPSNNGYALRDEYLSGNVRKKLAQAKSAGLDSNVRALNKVLPQDVPSHEIQGKLGAPWIPTPIYEEFIQSLLGADSHASVSYVAALNAFNVEVSGASQVANTNTHGIPDKTAAQIFTLLLNNKEIKVGYTNKEGQFILEKDKTDAALDKALAMRESFGDWLMSDADRSELLTREYNDKMNNYVVRKFKGAILSFPGKVSDSIIKFRRHQRDAIARIIQDGRGLLDHVVGAGKAQPLDAKILTPNGWKLMGDIQLGDAVISVDGTPTLVDAIFPQGEKEIFRITFSDGSSAECCEEHLWKTQTYKERGYAQRSIKVGKDWECAKGKVRSLKEIRETLIAPHLGAKNHTIPLVEPVQFKATSLPIAPYLMGVLLGDGGFSHKGVTITSADPELIAHCQTILPEGIKLGEVASGDKCPSWTLTNADSIGRASTGKTNSLKASLTELGLRGLSSHDKFIPSIYLLNSIEDRIELLRGLMDTDGSVNNRGTSSYFYTCSDKLADGVTSLVQSLGGTVQRAIKSPTYRHNGELKNGRPCHVLCIKININPFRLARKANKVIAKSSYAPVRYIVSIESVGIKPAQCIRVTHESHLYVTNDFVVTHNTFTVIGAAMELKRTGLAKKSMIAVPNHLVKQWATDFYKLYPGANILTATKKDFEKANRRKFLAKIATGDWDAVIIAHSSFGFIKPDPVFEAQFNADRIREIMTAINEMGDEKSADSQTKRTIKQLAKMRENLNNKIASLRDRPMDDLLDLGQLGVDQLFVDEAHMFKNLMFTSKMQNVRGLGQPEGSQRAYDMFIKTRQITEKNGGTRGIVFATGTPVSNSLAEMYHMMRYLSPEALADMGHQTFDAWANTFAEVEQVWMQAMSGDGYKSTNRMSKFVNTPDLLKAFNQVADTVTIEDIKEAYREENDGKEFPIPALKGGRRTPVSLIRTKAQNEYMDKIAERAKALEQRKGKPEKGEDNMLSILGDARKAAMDIRMVDPSVTERDPQGRIAIVAQNVFDTYQKFNDVRGTQLIFSDMGTPKKTAEKELKEYNELMAAVAPLQDANLQADADLGDESAISAIEKAEEAQAEMDKRGKDWLDSIQMAMRGFSIYDDTRQALIDLGIPEHEIAFIHDYNTDEQKAALFRAVNDGKIRVLMGSTPKMGAGTNVQERLVELHHMDVPWKPSDIEQREGRIIRQGNLLLELLGDTFEVSVKAYATQDTLDLFMWQVQEKKLGMINQLRTGNVGREMDDAFEELQMSAGEMQAAATSNPYLLEEIQLKDKVKKLERKKKQFEGQKNTLINSKKSAEKEIAQLPEKIAQAKEVQKSEQAYLNELESRPFSIKINGEEFTDDHEASMKLRELLGEDDKEEVAPPEGMEFADKPKKKKMEPIDINGLSYKSKTAVAEAFRKIAGDAAKISFVRNGETLIRRADIVSAIKADVMRAGETDDIVTVGKMGDFEFSIEGQHARLGGISFIVTAKVNGVELSDYQTANYTDMTALGGSGINEAIRLMERQMSRSGNNIPFLEHDLKSAKKTLADVLTADMSKEWDGGKELDDARLRYREVLKKINEAGTDIGKQNKFINPLQKADGSFERQEPAKFSRQSPGLDAQANAISNSQSAAISQVEADQVAGKVIAGLKNGLQGISIKVVDSVNDLPQVIIDQAIKEQAKEAIHGVNADNVIYLVRNQHATAEKLEQTLLHELMGHAGLAKLFGAEITQKMNELYKAIGENKGLTEIAVRHKLDLSEYALGLAKNKDLNDDQRIQIMMEELLSHIAQDKPTLRTKLKGLVGMIRSWLRKAGFTGLAQGTDADIYHLLNRARAALNSGATSNAGTRFSRAPTLEEMLAMVGEEITIDAHNPNGDDLEALSRLFLSNFPASTSKFLPGSNSARKAKKASDLAGNDIGGDPKAARVVEGSGVGVFSGYRTIGKIEKGLDGRQQLTISVYGKEQLAANLVDHPALTMAVTQDGEFSIYGAPSDSKTYAEFVKRGWGKPALDKNGEPHWIDKDAGTFWTALAQPTRFSLTPLLADAHARTLAWTGEEFTGLHWHRTTGATGGSDGHNGAIFFSRGIGASLEQAANNSSGLKQQAIYLVADHLNNSGKINWWHKTVGTQYNLAKKNPLFAKVYDRVQNFISDVSMYTAEAADLAPTILPKLDALSDMWKALPMSTEDVKAIRAPIFEGTLIWTRNADGKAVKLEDSNNEAKDATAQLNADINKRNEARRKKFDGFTLEQKKSELLGKKLVQESVMKMWLGLPNDQFEKMINNKFANDVMFIEDAIPEPESGKGGIVFNDKELNTLFNLNAKQIGIYKEFRAAIDKSLTNLAISDMVKIAGKDAKFMLNEAMATGDVTEAAELLAEHLEEIGEQSTADLMRSKAERAQELMDLGYAPLSRFGKYTVYVERDGEQEYFGMFEDKAEAAKMARQMKENFPDAEITHDTMSEESYKLFAGVSPETIELFGDMLGLNDGSDATKEAYQTYLKLAKNNRSSMKRLINRKGIKGFSEDAGRVLAGFVYSNGRQTASNSHMGELDDAVNAIKTGELKDAAVQLSEHVKNPESSSNKLGGLMFAQYLGGSVASAMVNLTQPITMTLPYLSQYGGIAKAGNQLVQAARDAYKKTTGDATLDAALKLAEEEGIVAPQEVHHIQAQAAGKGVMQTGDGTKMGDAKAAAHNAMSRISHGWGIMFSMAEMTNRRITFIAAYRTAKEQGMANPAKFAEESIAATQGVYNEGNRPRWARSTLGGLAMTFKQYSIAYVELLARMWNAGEPGSKERQAGRRGALYMLAVLFLLAGADGLPFENDLEDLIDTILQKMGYNFSSKRKKEEFLIDFFGHDITEFMLKGISGISGMPADMSRLGSGNLIPGTGLFKAKASHANDLMELMGAPGDFGKRVYEATGSALSGNVGDAMASLAPKAAANLLKGADMYATGEYKDGREYKIGDVSGFEAALKGIGFQPNSVAKAQYQNQQVKDVAAQVSAASSKIQEHWAQGLAKGDMDMVAEARQMRDDWNENNPETPIRVSMPGIIKRVRNMRMNVMERTEKAAPKALRPAVKREFDSIDG